MVKNLVIVESPAKAKTIQKFLGKDYQVKASMGHVRDLPKNKLGIDIDNNFEPTYTSMPSRSSLIKDLSAISKKVKMVYLATDMDREGEAIAWHLSEALKLPSKKISRVIFNEITQNAIKTAFASTSQINMNKVNAQQTRRILDRIVGYQLSPLLWKKITRGLSAGRVQSVAVKLIVDKEKEIQQFITEEYWKIIADVFPENKKEHIFNIELKKYKNKKIDLSNEKKAMKALEAIKKEKFIIDEVSQKEKTASPLPPFATSQLQQQASIQLGFRTKHTMLIAQQLYEGLDLGKEGPVGLITYMRTDSFQVSKEAIQECRDFIGKHYKKEYLPKTSKQYTNKKAQAAHEAIRPTSVFRTPDSIKSHLSNDQYKLYKLIWLRFVASQMSSAKLCLTTIKVKAGDYIFDCKGKQILFPGYYILLPPKKSEGEKLLPILKKDEILEVEKIVPSQHFTQPPPRFSEATLVKMLETRGIGRPSTYAPIITTIQDRGYVKIEEKKFKATELGIKVTEKLNEFFPKIMDFSFTSEMENNLDKIEEAKEIWQGVVDSFYKMFSHDLQHAYDNMESLKQNPETSEHKCDKCQAVMVYKYNKRGKFLGCSNFPECKNTISIDENGLPIFPLKTEHKCDKCGEPLILKTSKSGNFLGCSGYPECKNALPIGIDGKPILPEKTKERCPKCEKFLLKRQGPHGPFYACSGYPECDYIKPISDNKKPDVSKILDIRCDKCNKSMTIRKGPRGLFLGCTAYPQCKNIQKFSIDQVKLPDTFKAPVCPLCSKDLIMKYSKKGIFWGCSDYPKCNFTNPCNLHEIAASL